MNVILFPHIDPVIFSIGPVSVRWYSIAYVLGIIFAHWYLHEVDKYKIFNQKFHDSLLAWSIVGIVFGGRIGYMLIYNLSYYSNSPTEIFKIWHGGMSFHGGLIGCVIAIIAVCKKHNISALLIMDLLACAAPIGLFLGRIANFINGELFGRITDLPWGIIFPGDDLARHPSQLYEAVGEGLLLFIILNLLLFFTNLRSYRGALTGIGMTFYAIIRFLIEFFREPDLQIGYLLLNLTMGQLLSISMVIIGMIIITISIKNPSNL
ncbi:MAG: prolipoprotein diacylglyceryl transferase [Candidatus Mesenet longicola]|uniref:Phosphatidylglycerol--prolipoprotein diacylglyceryl transferase n=1 Tax=Candidatus Mesenet longicola TaxID=1892558 RepID=A0A8J3MPF1_9RICK|nr:MAG: prolipoprotein diacylglyceryl transferase [Candidatus Mesenet longicola]GHM59973.1 MAG: prolipoprotein diacylglyceryl transferase [Candidatus Mesenet longicola]